MKRNLKSRSKSNDKQEKNKSAKQAKLKSKEPKQRKVPKNVEEEKVQLRQPYAPILYSRGQFLSATNPNQIKSFEIGRVREDFREGDATIRFDFYEINNENMPRGAKTVRFVPDPTRRTTELDPDFVLLQLEVKKSQRGRLNEDQLEQDIRLDSRNIKNSKKMLTQKSKGLKDKQKQQRQAAKDQEKVQKQREKEESKANERQARAEVRKRRKLDDNDEEEKEGGVQRNVQDQPHKKRERKAVAKKVAAVPKVKEPQVLREDVTIPDIIEAKELDSDELQQNCCQTCANRNVMRAVVISSTELMGKCIIARANVTSLIEHMSPEMRYCAVEKAVQLNRHEILEMLLTQVKPESEHRIAKKPAQIVKYDTGEVGKMAFGFKIRKVQMMRGNRQGNNAFLEDSIHEHQTPADYLINNEYCIDRIFRKDSVDKQTLEIIKASVDQQRFDSFVDKSLPVLMRHGCQQTLLRLFEIIGKDNSPRDSFFNKVYFELLSAEKQEIFTITVNDILEANRNNKFKVPHVAALNPSGAGLRFLIAQNQEIDVYNKADSQNDSLAHYAAVCSSDISLQILVEQEIDLHDLDSKKKTPLMWALESSKPVENIKVILENINLQSSKDSKDSQKKMAVHYACQYGASSEVLQTLLQHRAKFSQFGGWDKYTPLIYAATYGQYEVVDYLLQHVPRINIDKGDKYQRSALIMACRNGHAKVVALLAKYNADLNQPDTSGNSPLHHATAYGWLECVQQLLKLGANTNPENAWKFTPITIALQKNHIAVVLELLKCQEVNVNSKDDEGRTLLALSMANINVESIQFIKMLVHEKGADVNGCDAKGRTPMYHLVESMSKKKRGLFDDHDELEFKIIDILIEAGANINIKAKDNKSPFTLAFEGGVAELVQKFGGSIDLNEDPTLFYAFTGVSVLKVQVQKMLVDCLRIKPLEDETINYVNENGFTPFLFYIKEFGQAYTGLQATVEQMLRTNEEINNETIIQQYLANKANNQNIQNGVHKLDKKVKDLVIEEIVEPFLRFVKILLDSGANPNAYVLKLKQYREEFDRQATPASQQVNQLSQPQVAAFARRVPEKEQYISENQGLCGAIHLVIENPQKRLFDFLIAIPGIELNQVNFQKMTPFFQLVKTKDIKNVNKYKYMFQKLLATNKVDINAPDQFGMSAFWFFYTSNRVQEAFFLVDHGANINHMDNYGFFALKRELLHNNLVLMEQLLEKGADPNQTDEFGRTVLHLACNKSASDMKRVFTLLSKYKADNGVLDMKRRTALHYMFVPKNKRGEQGKIEPLNQGLDLLLNPAAIKAYPLFDINQQDVNGKTLLHYAAQRGSVLTLDYIINLYGLEGIHFDLEDKWLNTPLSVAINCKHFDFVERLISLGVANLKQFIYEEPKPKNQPQLNNMFGNVNMNNQQDDEQSDFEFMEIEQFNGQDSNGDPVKGKHNKDEALNLFRYVIRHGMGQLEKLFIKEGYDRVQMVIDYICEGQIDNLFKVIEEHFKDAQGAKGSILIQRNKKEQNMIHVLSRHSHLIKDITQITKFYKQMIEEGVEPHAVDYKGRDALHLAVKSGNIHLIKFLVDVEGFDVNSTDRSGANAIVSLLKGDRILKAKTNILEYLIKKNGNVNQLYQELQYKPQKQTLRNLEENKAICDNGPKEQYFTTCVIHCIRHESKERDNIKEVLKVLLKNGANASLQDSDGRDAFMYIAMRNHVNTFNFIISSLKQHNAEKLDASAQGQKVDGIVGDHTDKFGKTAMHYVVNPLEYGSYENGKLLKKMNKYGFKWNVKDREGKTPYDYALEQQSGVLKKVFELFGEDCMQIDQQPNERLEEQLIQNVDDIIDGAGEERINFERDAHRYLQQIQMQIDPRNYVPCDASGKFNDDCEVMFDDQLEQHFDIYLTRVEIGKFQPGGDYLFYRMQLVLDKSRDLPILLTRWGRIGEEGAFQRTPFSTKEEAIAEFRKVFEQKTGNKWCVQDKFAKKFKKFQRMRTNYVTIDQKNYLVPFDLEHAQLPKEMTQKELDIMREVCDVNTYLRALQNSGIDLKAMPFSNINRQNLYDAMEQLQKLQKTLQKLEGLNPRPYSENERNKLLALREKMWYLSSRFYEFLPHEEFRNKMVPPISTIDMLMQKSAMIQSLIEIETASKILMGAHYSSNNVHPLEYCLKACGIDMQVLSDQSAEFNLIQQYTLNTYVDRNNERKQVKNIIRLSKHSEQSRFSREASKLEGDRVLLFHGSKMSNILGIMSSGLRVQPLGAQRQGALLGKGIYFTDMLSKAMQYTVDKNAPATSSRFVLVCEVALGNVKEITRFQRNPDEALGDEFNSIHGVGREGPESDKFVTLPDGAKLPIGKHQVHQERALNEFQFSEYVVPDPRQVKMRYLIQLK